jgi:hypothetical protein
LVDLPGGDEVGLHEGEGFRRTGGQPAGQLVDGSAELLRLQAALDGATELKDGFMITAEV